MKTNYILSLFMFLPFFSASYGQNQLKSPSSTYPSGKIDENGKEILFNDKMLNILFANNVGTAFGGSNDLSLQKFYASLDADDKSIAIGANFDSRCGDETKKLNWVFSGGFKIKAKDKFATIYKNGDFQEDNIGATLKISLIGNGIINFTSTKTKQDRYENVLQNRAYLCEKYDKKVSKFNSDELPDLKTKNATLKLTNPDEKDLNKVLEEKEKEDFIALAKEEIEYLEKNKMYHYLWNHWYSLEVFTPFGENTYKTTNDIVNNPLKDRKFYAFTATLSGNTMWQFSSGQSIFIKGKLNLKNNNNIIVDNMTATPFQTTTIGSGGITVVTNSDDGYSTDFKQFLTTSLTIEPSFFIFKNTIGFSPAIEFNQGKYDKTNWKLGIPISLKDKDGKPKVNFEVQWKEVNTFTTSTHLVGISANFLFGELIN